MYSSLLSFSPHTSGGDCSGPVSWDNLGSKPGWWKIPKEDRDIKTGRVFAECLYPLACPGSKNTSGENVCATELGFRNESRLCQSCAPGNSRTTKSICVSCGNSDSNGGKSVIVAVAVLVILILFIMLNTLRMRSFRSFDAQRRRKSLHSTIKRIVLSHLQMVSIVLGLSVPWPPLLETVLNTVSSVASFSEGKCTYFC